MRPPVENWQRGVRNSL